MGSFLIFSSVFMEGTRVQTNSAGPEKKAVHGLNENDAECVL